MTKRRPPDRQTILIADDSEIKRAIPADMLGKECEIIEAANGMRALETIRERNMEVAVEPPNRDPPCASGI